ncbi:MAG: DUF1796 family putative cysteine peptidase [Syntrophaceae bacterium]|nr:papain-like cysteine peptidase [Deltaproteobacteria bacterium]
MTRSSNLFQSQADAGKFDKIISLGCNCELTWNIRSYFGIERAYPLDWWITPFQALWKLLENRFHDLFNISNLEVSQDLLTVRDTYYNLLYHHDFKRTEDDKIIRDGLDQQVPLLKQKYDMLIERFFKDPENKRVLFVRNRDGNIPHLDRDTTPMDNTTFEQLYTLLEKLFPDSQISLLITNCPLFPRVRRTKGDILWDEIAIYDDAQFFAGSPRGWQEMFCRNNILYKK